MWFEVYENGNSWQVYKVTENSYTLFKTFKTEKAVRNFAKTHWVKRWA